MKNYDVGTWEIDLLIKKWSPNSSDKMRIDAEKTGNIILFQFLLLMFAMISLFNTNSNRSDSWHSLLCVDIA